MMISLCQNKRLWQQVDFNMSPLKDCDTQVTRIRDICSELSRFKRIQRTLSMDYDRKILSKSSTTKELSKVSMVMPTETLRDILQKEEKLRQNKVGHLMSLI
ncbi:hypothetical protein V8C35DRAFT_319098 [Trichoderma chlorosporum]